MALCGWLYVHFHVRELATLLMFLSVLLPGVYVIGPGESGVLFEHRESEWGDHANVTDIITVIQQMAPPERLARTATQTNAE